MKRYYIAGKEVTAEQAEQTEAKNKELVNLAMETGDINVMCQCKFIIVWDDGRMEV